MARIEVTRMSTSGDTISPSDSPEAEMVNVAKMTPAPTAYQIPLGRPSAAAGARETRITLTIAEAIPAIAKIDGTPSVMKPKTTGSVAVSTAATGATTPIRPMLKPR